MSTDLAMQYASLCQQSAEIAERIVESLLDHRGADQDSVTWSHVSEAKYILERLRELERLV